MVAWALSGLAATPALAYHQNVPGHWANRYPPLVTTDCGFLGGTICNYTGDAERFWSGNAWQFGGFRVGNPFYGCGPFSGWISVCAVPNGDPRLRGSDAVTYAYVVPGDPAHIDSVQIFVDDSLYFAPNAGSRLQRAIRQEYGHAIGLGHSTNTNGSVMHGCPPNDGNCMVYAVDEDWHDAFALNDSQYGMYDGHVG